MDMAGLPVLANQNSLSTPDERFLDAIAEQIAAGRRPEEIARRVYPDDRVKRNELRRRVWHFVRTDPAMHRKVAERAHGEMVLALVTSAKALAGRASRGRPDAIKLLFEASGFHNPRVKHDHSGDINVRLTIPRPTREPAIDGEAEVVD